MDVLYQPTWIGVCKTLANPLKKDARVVFAYLFGGLGRDEQSPLSDVDIAVHLEKDADVSCTKMPIPSKFSTGPV